MTITGYNFLWISEHRGLEIFKYGAGSLDERKGNSTIVALRWVLKLKGEDGGVAWWLSEHSNVPARPDYSAAAFIEQSLSYSRPTSYYLR